MQMSPNSSPCYNKLKRRIDLVDNDSVESIQNNKKYLSQAMADSIGFLSLNDDYPPPNINSNNNNLTTDKYYKDVTMANGFNSTNNANTLQQEELQQQTQPMNIQYQQQQPEQQYYQQQIVPQSIYNGSKALAIIPSQEPIYFSPNNSKNNNNVGSNNASNTNDLKLKFNIPFRSSTMNTLPISKFSEEIKSKALILYSEPSEIISGSLRKEIIEKRKQQKILQEIQKQKEKEKEQQMVEDTDIKSNCTEFDPMPI